MAAVMSGPTSEGYNMEWKFHYTGIDIAEGHLGRVNLYLQRDSKDKRVRFARLSIPYHMVGVFIGRGNYVKGSGGWELFTRNHHIGWSKDWTKRFYRVDWSGSRNEPWCSFTIRLGRFGIGGRTPKWLKRRKEELEQRKWEAMEPPPWFPSDYNPEDDGVGGAM
jgi:hypothetical protein